jgi:transposase-like protein
MGQPETHVGALCRDLGVTRQTLYRHVAPERGAAAGRGKAAGGRAEEWLMLAVRDNILKDLDYIQWALKGGKMVAGIVQFGLEVVEAAG